MKRDIIVRHMHRYTKEKAELYRGKAEFSMFPDYMEIIYIEAGDVKVMMRCYENYMEIKRNGEAVSHLTLVRQKKTLNPVSSIYGTFEIEAFTHDYQRNDHDIMVSYDIENGSEEKDGFQIEITLLEGKYECN